MQDIFLNLTLWTLNPNIYVELSDYVDHYMSVDFVATPSYHYHNPFMESEQKLLMEWNYFPINTITDYLKKKLIFYLFPYFDVLHMFVKNALLLWFAHLPIA